MLVSPGGNMRSSYCTGQVTYRVETTSKGSVDFEVDASDLNDFDIVQAHASRLFEEEVAIPTVDHPLYFKTDVPHRVDTPAGRLVTKGYVSGISAYYGNAVWSLDFTLDNSWAKWFSYPGFVTFEIKVEIKPPDGSHLGSSPTLDFDLSKYLTQALVGASSIVPTGSSWVCRGIFSGMYRYLGTAPSFRLRLYQSNYWTGTDSAAYIYVEIRSAYMASFFDIKALESPV